MSIPDLLADAFSAGINLSVVASGLAWTSPPGAMTPSLLLLLRRHKAEILDFLRWTKEPGEPSSLPQPFKLEPTRRDR